MSVELDQRIEEQLALERAYGRVFGDDDGQLVLRHMAKVANMADSTFVPGSPDISAFNEGRRHFFLSILRILNRDPFRTAQQLMEERS